MWRTSISPVICIISYNLKETWNWSHHRSFPSLFLVHISIIHQLPLQTPVSSGFCFLFFPFSFLSPSRWLELFLLSVTAEGILISPGKVRRVTRGFHAAVLKGLPFIMRAMGILERAKRGHLNNQICHFGTSVWLKDGTRIRMEGRFRTALIPGWLGKTGSCRSCRCFSPDPGFRLRVLHCRIPPGCLWIPVASRKSPCWFKPPGLFTVCCHAYNTAHLFPCLSGSLFCHLNAESCPHLGSPPLERFHGVQLGVVPPWAALTGVCLLEYLPHGSVIICWVVWLFPSPVKPGTVICHNMPGLGRQWAFSKYLLSF